MSKELYMSNLTSLTKQLTTRREVEFVYYNVQENKGKQQINYTIVCDVDNVIGNIDLLKEIVANMELTKALYSRTNVLFNYTIKTSRAFEEDLMNKREETIKELSTGEIIYSNDDYLESYINERNKSEKSRH